LKIDTQKTNIQKKMHYIYIRCRDRSDSPCNWREENGECRWRFKEKNIKKSPCVLMINGRAKVKRYERVHEIFMGRDENESTE
jgi:hypothetical protein